MQIHELPDVTAIGSGGYFATDNGSQTTKIDYDALAKAIIEQYSASTLAGSAQSVKAALDGVKTDLNVVYGANSIKTLAATDDLLTLDVGMYRVANVLPLNAPSTTYKYGYATKQHRGAAGYTYYEFIVGNGNGNDFKRFYGWQYSNSAASIDWIEMAPQSAVDALNDNIYTEINTGIASSYGTLQYKCYKTGHIVGFAGQLALTSDCQTSVDIITGLPTLGSLITNYSPVRMFNNTASQYVDMSLHRTGTGATSTLSIYTRSALSSGASLRFNFTYCCE